MEKIVENTTPSGVILTNVEVFDYSTQWKIKTKEKGRNN